MNKAYLANLNTEMYNIIEVYAMKDLFDREIDYLRISVTDRCNLRCNYCMPTGIECMPMSEILTFEEITQICSSAVKLGIKHIRITGGEPLVRREIEKLISMIKEIDGIESIAMTTNGIWLGEKIKELKKAGLDSINISLDTLDRDKFKIITGFDVLHKVLDSIDKATESGIKVKINTVILEDTLDENIGTLRLAKKGIDVRFIEMMPIGAGANFRSVDSGCVLEQIKAEYPTIRPIEYKAGNGPAVYYQIDGIDGKIGFIKSVHGKFCSECNRIRLTSTGILKTCLCYDQGMDLKKVLRENSGEGLEQLMEQTIKNKPKENNFCNISYIPQQNSMSEIGG